MKNTKLDLKNPMRWGQNKVVRVKTNWVNRYVGDIFNDKQINWGDGNTETNRVLIAYWDIPEKASRIKEAIEVAVNSYGLSEGKVIISSQGPSRSLIVSGREIVNVDILEVSSGRADFYQNINEYDVSQGEPLGFRFEDELSLSLNKGLETYNFLARDFTFNQIIREGNGGGLILPILV